MALANDLLRAALSTLAVSLASACASGPNAPPGMIVVESSGATSAPGSMLVAFPKSTCTGSDSAVFLDEKGAFVSAVAPGTATYVAFPPGAAKLFVVSSKDVVAPPGLHFRRSEIMAPGERVDRGIVVEVPRIDGKNCYRGAIPRPTVVSYQDATRAALPLAWLDIQPDEGTHWLDEHRPRVTELLGTPSPP